MSKLTAYQEEVARHVVEKQQIGGETMALSIIGQLLSELDRIRPVYTPVEQVTIKPNALYEVAGVKKLGARPYHAGRARQLATGTWIDEDTGRPINRIITHVVEKLPTIQVVGHPKFNGTNGVEEPTEVQPIEEGSQPEQAVAPI
jgi:hypothetical protein